MPGPSTAPCLLFAGGGTGGHLYPAIAVAEEVKRLRSDARIVFAGTKRKIEARVVPQRGYEFHAIWISGFHRRLTLENILFPLKVVVSLVQSFFLIRRLRPAVVVGTGGYVCGPVLFVASLLGIPTVIHESNSYPGVTTRMLASRAAVVLLGFAVTKRWLRPGVKTELAGTPTRKELGAVGRSEGAVFFGLSPERKTLLVFGGSLGAASINRATAAMAEDLAKEGIQIIWQTGPGMTGELPENAMVKILPFVDRMDCAYAAADLVLCRAGATTIAEITALGKPAVLVPYPFAAAHHQEMNAATLAEVGAAVVISDKDLPAKGKFMVADILGDDGRRRAMGEASRRIGRRDAAENIAKRVLEIGGLA